MLSMTVLDVILAAAVLISTSITIFIITLPKAFSHFDTISLDESSFSEEDRQDAVRSGFKYFEDHKNESGQLQQRTSVQVVVLGDVGRSPRMQYHASSLAKHGANVQLIGYMDSQLHPDVSAARFITPIGISKTPELLQTSSKALFVLMAPLKVIYQTLALYRALAYQTTASRYMLVQNPPSIPLLAVAVFVCFFRNTSLIIDWHNFGYSILALRLGFRHPLVRLSRWYEGFVSHGADAHITVTDAMKQRVKDDFGLKAVTLHDRPAEQFQPLSGEDKMAFLAQCETTKPFLEEIKRRSRRVLVSSTSWTADEDFEVLLQALVTYSIDAKKNNRAPKLLVIITGKGPQKHYYQDRIADLEQQGKLEHVAIRTAWLSIADYANILASADLGISLHTSSSGVDLPMKVLDMFGAGLPVAGWSKYASWPELVHEGVNGLGFGSSEELATILLKLFASDDAQLQTLKQGVLEEGKHRWNDEWRKIAPIFRLDFIST